ncbi:hypothetical protein [unidentified bacterial endosymbiont]|uniref:hypothetical protein n=1 Tax=unidentified bacterial endosymbiont TaxID=2355 RepID=UPI0020A03745|nr:hypothetical protein [unidentified bacterial endosymbiont]
MEIDFFQEVKIISGNDKTKKYIGFKGIVLGIGKENEEIEGYDVYIYDVERVAGFSTGEIIPTGVRFKREDFYNGSYAKVSPTGELLDLHLVDETTNKPSNH